MILYLGIYKLFIKFFLWKFKDFEVIFFSIFGKLKWLVVRVVKILYVKD